MTMIHKKMIAVMQEVSFIGKEQKNTSQGFNFRGIDDIYNNLHQIMSKHGVFCRAEIISKTREERKTPRGGMLAFTCLRMRYFFVAEDGSEVWTDVEGEGMDSGDKSSNKAMAVGHKYALLQAFMIPTKEMNDPDAESPEAAPKEDIDPEIMESLALAATYGTKTFREEWKKVSPGIRSNISKEYIKEWKKTASDADMVNVMEEDVNV